MLPRLGGWKVKDARRVGGARTDQVLDRQSAYRRDLLGQLLADTADLGEPERGTFSGVTGWSVSSAAATIGRAAFLFPDGVMDPQRRCPPSTMNCTAAILLTGEESCVE